MVGGRTVTLVSVALIGALVTGCVPRGAVTPPEPASAPALAPTSRNSAPRLELDLTNLTDAPPAWELRPVTAGAVEVRAASYTVKRGDTLRSIGEATGAGSDSLARVNGLSAPFKVTPGQILIVPAGRYHRIREGETGIAIARAYGVTWGQIIEANALTDPYVLRIGQRLALPGKAQVAAVKSGGPRAEVLQIGIDDIVTGAEPARSTAVVPPAPASASPARFAWPMSGAIVGRFGPLGGGRVSQGIDIAATAGAGVRATASGTVAYVGSGVPGYGGLILLRHEGGWISAYGRVATSNVAKGDNVRSGQQIGKAGSEGPLHFELRRSRTPVDPVKYLPIR